MVKVVKKETEVDQNQIISTSHNQAPENDQTNQEQINSKTEVQENQKEGKFTLKSAIDRATTSLNKVQQTNADYLNMKTNC